MPFDATLAPSAKRCFCGQTDQFWRYKNGNAGAQLRFVTSVISRKKPAMTGASNRTSGS